MVAAVDQQRCASPILDDKMAPRHTPRGAMRTPTTPPFLHTPAHTQTDTHTRAQTHTPIRAFACHSTHISAPRYGTASFAKTSRPNSRTSNIFVNTLDNSYLDEYGFVPFGQVHEEDMAVVGRMYAGHGGNVPQNYTR